MALDYFAPGVYVEEVDRGSRPIEGVNMSVPGFIGFTEDIKGDAEPFKPMLVTNWAQFCEYFGKPNSDGFTDYGAYLPFAVRGWFDNGGGRCWVTSIGTQLPGTKVTNTQEAETKLLTSAGKTSLEFKFKPGYDPMRVNILVAADTPKELETPPENEEDLPFDDGRYFKVILKQGSETKEYRHLTMNPQPSPEDGDYGEYVVTALADSEWVTVVDFFKTAEEAGQMVSKSPLTRRPKNGSYDLAPVLAPLPTNRIIPKVQGNRETRTGLQGNFEVDDIATIAFPDLMLLYQKGLIDIDQVHGVMEAMVSYCENAFPSPAFRMVVLDPPPIKPGKNNNEAVRPEEQKPQDVAQWLSMFNRRSMFGAVYYPWIQVPNPRDGGKPISVPPSGHMLGIWCRTDQSRGIFKAPANETPRGVIGLAYDTNIREQEFLNPMGINCIRNFANYQRGYKVWGARTLVEPDNIQWRYISVRRLMSYISKSIEMGTQWVVFEPNDMDLWERVKRTVSSFLETLWRQGALFGASTSEAFYVKCDASNNTPDTMMKGRLYIDIGVCPVRPAEFVIFRIGQTTQAGGS